MHCLNLTLTGKQLQFTSQNYYLSTGMIAAFKLDIITTSRRSRSHLRGGGEFSKIKLPFCLTKYYNRK